MNYRLRVSTIIALALGVAFATFSCKQNDDSPVQTGVGAQKLTSSEYPPAPPELMQAELTKLDGTKFKLADKAGTILLVNLWATWCGPCKQEIPEFIKLQSELGDKRFEVIGMNLEPDEDAKMLEEFGKEFGVNYDLVKGDQSLYNEFYNVSKREAIPQTFLIDRQGKLVGVFVGSGKNVTKIADAIRRLIE